MVTQPQPLQLLNADPHEVHAFIHRRFGAKGLKLFTASRRTGNRAFLHYRSLGKLDILTLSFGCHAEITPSGKETFYHFQLVLNGRGILRYPDRDLVLNAGEAGVINQRCPLKVLYDADCRKVIIRISAEQLHADAVSFGYRLPEEGIVFRRRVLSVAATGTLAHIVNALTDEYDHQGSEQLEEHYRRILSHLLLTTFDNNLTRFHTLKPSRNPMVEKIRQYIMEHPREKISADTLAALCGVSKKTIYNLFERELDISPGAYVIRIKLEFIYDELLKKERVRNVTEVAIGYGFTNLGRFSRQYMDYFGELPSHTFRRAI